MIAAASVRRSHPVRGSASERLRLQARRHGPARRPLARLHDMQPRAPRLPRAPEPERLVGGDLEVHPSARVLDALDKRMVAVDDCRSLTKADLPLNDARPDITVDPDTFAVRIDGELIEAAPAAESVPSWLS